MERGNQRLMFVVPITLALICAPSISAYSKHDVILAATGIPSPGWWRLRARIGGIARAR